MTSPPPSLRSPATGAVLTAGPHDLHAAGERWPVVDGIAFLRADRRALADAALAALDAGDAETACVILLADQDGWASTPPPDEAARRFAVRERAALSFRAAMDVLAFGPVATYFAHRWSDPTFLSGLALAEAHWHAPDRIVELACGAGHYLREFARVRPQAEITGGDLVFAKLWLARHFVAPQAKLLCFDAAQPWPLPDASADLVFCHDAFYFLPDKQRVAGEMLRVAGGQEASASFSRKRSKKLLSRLSRTAETTRLLNAHPQEQKFFGSFFQKRTACLASGRILVGHAHNAAVENLSHGAPLLPEDYAALFGQALLYDDRELTTALAEARAPHPADAANLQQAPAVALAAGAAAADVPRMLTGGLAMPQPGRQLMRNPLYAEGAGTLRFPSPRYEAEYASLATYRPTTDAPARAVAGDPALEGAIRRRELLDLPAEW